MLQVVQLDLWWETSKGESLEVMDAAESAQFWDLFVMRIRAYLEIRHFEHVLLRVFWRKLQPKHPSLHLPIVVKLEISGFKYPQFAYIETSIMG